MNKLSAKQIIEINSRLTDSDNSNFGLEPINQILAEVYKKDERGFYIYKDAVEKAAKLACEIEKAKPFTAKNTTTAIFSMFLLLQVNGIRMPLSQENIANIIEQMNQRNADELASKIYSLLQTSLS